MRWGGGRKSRRKESRSDREIDKSLSPPGSENGKTKEDTLRSLIMVIVDVGAKPRI